MSTEQDLFDHLRDLWRSGFRGQVLLNLGTGPESVDVELTEKARTSGRAERLLRERIAALTSRATG